MTVELDARIGEGGGQVVRTAVGLAAATGQDLALTGIRRGRSPPGLRPQHVSAVRAVAQACDGTLEGDEVGSDELVFQPGKLSGGTVGVDPGTAANVNLVLQALLPLAPALPEPLRLDAIGGTDTKWAPTLAFTTHVLAPLAALAGVRLEVERGEEGFYPRGDGRLRVLIHPAARPAGWPGVLEDRGSLKGIEVVVRLHDLPDHVAERVSKSAVRPLQRAGYEVKRRTVQVQATDPGVVVDAIATFEHTVLGANTLGEKGLPSEVVGGRCATALLSELEGPGTVDVHAADQLVPLLHDVPGAGFVVREATGHLGTNLAVVQRLTGTGSMLQEVEDGWRVRFPT